LLGALAKSPSERHQLLKGYFVPSETEREQGLKMPTRGSTNFTVTDGHVETVDK